MPASILTIRSDTVIAETIGDETMIIDTLSGAFYTLRGLGSPIWKLLELGVSKEEIVGIVQGHYPGEDPAAAIDEMIGVLRDDEIIVVVGPALPAEAQSSASGDPQWPTIYAPPLVERHADMSDLLLVDPLHDVDDSGWPQRAT